MAGIVVNLEHDSFLSDFLTVPIVGLCELSEPFDELGQLSHWTSIIVVPTDNVYKWVGFFLNILIWRY